MFEILVNKLVLGEFFTNCYVLTYSPGKCVVFDIGDGAAVLLRFLGRENLTPTAIFLTHGHFDHIAGVESVRKQYDIPVYVHKLDEPMMRDTNLNLATWISSHGYQPIVKWETIEDGDTFTLGEHQMQVLHTPGHTKGSVTYLCENHLFTGDTLFHLSRGRTDFPGGSDADMLASFRRLFALPGDYQVHPGHNDETTLDYERRCNPTIRELRV